MAKCTLYIFDTYMGNASRLSSKKNHGLRCAEKKFSLNCNGEDRLRRGIAGSRIRCELEFFAIFFMRLIERYLAHSLNIINISEARIRASGDCDFSNAGRGEMIVTFHFFLLFLGERNLIKRG